MDERIAGLCVEILEDAARVASVDASAPIPADDPAGVIANNANPMAGGPNAVSHLVKIQSSVHGALRYLRQEPFIVRILVEDDGGERRSYYFCRATPPTASLAKHGTLASYRSRMGRLAELNPGDAEEVSIAGRERTLRVLERVELKPRLNGTVWDAIDNRFQIGDARRPLHSLRQFLESHRAADGLDDFIAELTREDLAAADASARREGFRREAQRTLSLRDQAVLDAFQGKVFRRRLGERIMLSGPPGTGKTTTLIKRLAQKLDIECWEDDERERLGNDIGLSQRWVMFSPTDLLKLYLKEAFAKEQVPASEDRIRTWSDERLRLGRNVLRILSSGASGRFFLKADPLLLDDSSPAAWSLYTAFQAHLENDVVTRYALAFEQSLGLSPSVELREQIVAMKQRAGERAIQYGRLFDLVEVQSSLAKFLRPADGSEKEPEKDPSLTVRANFRVREMIRALLRRHPDLVDEIGSHLEELEVRNAGPDDGDDEEEDEAVRPAATDSRRAKALLALERALRWLARETLRGGGPRTSARYFELVRRLGDRRPSEDELRALGALLTLRQHVAFLAEGHKNLVERLPEAFQRFRRRALQDGGIYYAVRERIIRNEISATELDVLVLSMLRSARRLTARPDRRWRANTPLAILEAIEGEYYLQVLVDEATDFSSVQLACMLELAHPKFRSLFASGDLRQRMTAHGVRSLAEFSSIADDFQVEEITVGYRQSPILIEFSKRLAGLLPGPVPAVRAFYEPQLGDVPPLLVEGLTGLRQADWIAKRIGEIEGALGSVPSVAVFVPGDADVSPVADDLSRVLADRHIEVRACHNGRDVGHDNEIRVFSSEYIKGLEFEAVFFVSIDRLFERAPDLFGQTIYVGTTRSSRYLALTCDVRLPSTLEALRPEFTSASWDQKNA